MATVGRLVAVGNVGPAVKASAYAVTASVKGGGVAIYLKHRLDDFQADR